MESTQIIFKGTTEDFLKAAKGRGMIVESDWVRIGGMSVVIGSWRRSPRGGISFEYPDMTKHQACYVKPVSLPGNRCRLEITGNYTEKRHEVETLIAQLRSDGWIATEEELTTSPGGEQPAPTAAAQTEVPQERPVIEQSTEELRAVSELIKWLESGMDRSATRTGLALSHAGLKSRQQRLRKLWGLPKGAHWADYIKEAKKRMGVK